MDTPKTSLNGRYARCLAFAAALTLALASGCTPAPAGNGNTQANGNAPANENEPANDNGSGAVVPANAIFPGDYRETFEQVRDCQLTGPHGSSYTIVWVNSEAVESFSNDVLPYPEGSTLVKEEYSAQGCDPATLTGWLTRRKEAAGFDTDDGDWYWQHVSSDPFLGVVFDHAQAQAQCLACHGVEPCLSRDYGCNP